MIVATFNCSYIINRCVSNVRTNSARYLSFKTVRKTVTNYFRSEDPKPPYNHIVQVGDPVLRTKATPVDKNVIETGEFQKVLDQLTDVMRRYAMVALSAPQIGLPWQIFAIELTDKSLRKVNPELRDICEMEPIPLMYFINPQMAIRNPMEVVLNEICGSIVGFTAEVSRAKEVEIKALNRIGEPFSWHAKGWAARIAQHEFDHLQGKLFIDRMDPTTFECTVWEQINRNNGKVQLKYYRR
ncbi:peptide deformylase, mitochondrial-like isoform X1 [Hylaeus anthracinus]|uniref:peptide deformylase, mitochondrial-like isoform X1 n=1 Tax=Hylaeus anthracinus TaxID=313031 RepID=UPI0023B8B630|nr:peptide deformylase, mitochondrial-like isoform X1 [Hylaeus anthracinus]